MYFIQIFMFQKLSAFARRKKRSLGADWSRASPRILIFLGALYPPSEETNLKAFEFGQQIHQQISINNISLLLLNLDSLQPHHQ